MNRVFVQAAGTLIAALCLALAAPVALATNDDDDDEVRGRGACTATAQLMFKACGHEASDDYYLARAKCENVADARARAECVAEARRTRKEENGQCRARLDWRRKFCPVLGEGRYDPQFTPDRFDADFRHLSNPNTYFPLGIGNRWEYRGTGELTQVEVLDETKLISGVTCLVVRDVVFRDGALLEATDDWLAAGRDGSTWYCGEEVKDYATFEGDRPQRPELVSRDGSFKHGTNGDKAGILMPARPQAGHFYREEFSLGNAEDAAQVLTTTYSHGSDPTLDHLVPRALAQRLCNRDCVITRNFSLLEPGVFALKYYARGIGFFLEIKPQESKTLQLVSCNFDTRCVGLPTP